MSVIIVGGNECMERRYLDLCKEYGHTAKVFTKSSTGFRSKFGMPDLIVLFTNTVSHKMVNSALTKAKACNAKVERSHSSSISALKTIIEKH